MHQSLGLLHGVERLSIDVVVDFGFEELASLPCSCLISLQQELVALCSLLLHLLELADSAVEHDSQIILHLLNLTLEHLLLLQEDFG